MERYLTRKLKLVVNQQKSCVRSTDGLEFLGFQFTGYGGQMRVSPKNCDKFKQRVRELTRRRVSISMTTRLKALGYYLRGWTGYFCLVPIKSFFVVLDKWVRRRIRSCYWKQWRKPSARIRNLMTTGAGNGTTRYPSVLAHEVPGLCRGCRKCPKHSHQRHLSTNRLGQSIRSLEQACSQEMKRLVRTRMLGVVGGVPGNRAPMTSN